MRGYFLHESLYLLAGIFSPGDVSRRKVPALVSNKQRNNLPARFQSPSPTLSPRLMYRWQIGYDYEMYVYRDTTSAEIMKPRTMRQ